ncbi:A-kinase anchor protein 5 [Hemicordylus capensis]|uniref:A-kinase anchor protein 5 n=1 Tax=Hemicordylus capensis TaxID=884348 RepID=UPI002303E8DC|nr:A-kinase anchor protein 5 [Hemicordylus capensis]XP_053140283.1 A-kinase anchor protein 5 [Hemicordylus capensis]XP_053140284.1 A-kinase anchor protein 5 [Hemicordylus capensis]XP_053140285.1 A-kinase anchor protein 5 [Hemicordylus capensis]XP_053140286.1 A-kinase anchor protein 5 [Hemicordylus capensis]XP_053140287.1 A-kinase anchor protein 5 [Hemicordylus capensis]
MGDTAKEIQVESIRPSETSNASKTFLPNVSPAKKASVFCFKKRKKSCEKVMEEDKGLESDSLSLKHKNHQSSTVHTEAELSSPSWTSGGAWLALKRLVTSRKRSKSALKKQTRFSSQVQLETNADVSGLPCFPKEQTSSGLKIPCLRFSRSKKRSGYSDIIEEVDHGEKAEETTSILNNKANSEPENVVLVDSLSNEQSPPRAPEEKEGDSSVMKNIGDMVISPGENTFVVEMRPDPDQYTGFITHSEIRRSEAVLETEEEKQIFQLHHGSLYGDPEDVENKRVDLQLEIGPLFLQELPGIEHTVFKVEDAKVAETELEKDGGEISIVGDINGAKEGNSVEVMLHSSPSALEEEASSAPDISGEEVKSEGNMFAMPGVGIVITITEAEEFQDEEEPSHICEPFTFPQTSKQKGSKKSSKGPNSGTGGHGHQKEGKTCPQVPLPFSSNDQEHRSSEQYEVLLVETATSLVKAAIQSSIEQLVNEMAFEQNKQNSFL